MPVRLYAGVENLLPYADILIPSEEFALGHTKTENAEDAAKILFEKYSPEIVVITQGKKGGIIFAAIDKKVQIGSAKAKSAMIRSYKDSSAGSSLSSGLFFFKQN